MPHLTTPKFQKLFANYPLGSQESSNDPVVVAKLFDTFGSATWYITEYSSTENIAFSYVTGLSYDEWGYVSLAELESLMLGSQIPRIEQDQYFEPVQFSKLGLSKC